MSWKGPRGIRRLLQVPFFALLLVVAAIAAWRLQDSRDREAEARLREVHTLTT